MTTILAATGAFAGTNVDDIIVVTLFFLAARRGALNTWKIVAGQYLGVGTLIAASLLATLGLAVVPDRWTGLLGLIPFGLGVWGFVKYFRHRTRTEQERATVLNPGGLLGVIGVTVANGADNIAVYTPLFRALPTADTILTLVVFVVLIGVWLLAGRLIVSHPRVVLKIANIEGWLVPTVFCILGLVILAKSGVLPW
ncbi:CadD family cadmium resistance transporter [Microbacterium xylanilyticum]